MADSSQAQNDNIVRLYNLFGLIFEPLYYILIAMTIQQIYDLALEMGMNADPRGVARVKEVMKKAKKAYDELPEKKKKLFDTHSLENPYSDSRLLFGNPKAEVKAVLAGIDTDGAEVLLADRLNEKGRDIGLVISHHPSGHALAALHEVMELQIDMFAKAGVPENVAQALFEERMGLVKRRFGPINHGQAVDIARALEIPYMALHTIWDNLGDKFMKDLFAKNTFETAGDVLDVINDIPEFAEAHRQKAGPEIVSGSRNRRAGRVVVSFTGGTNPSKELYVEMAKAGVGTIVEMHVAEDVLTELKKHHVNVIDCGHMAADSIGANIFLDALEKKGVEIIPVSGLFRHKRTK